MSVDPPVLVSTMTPTAKFLGVGRDVIGQQLLALVGFALSIGGTWVWATNVKDTKQDDALAAMAETREIKGHARDIELADLRARVAALEAVQMGLGARR